MSAVALGYSILCLNDSSLAVVFSLILTLKETFAIWKAIGLLVFQRKDLGEAKPNVECSKKWIKMLRYAFRGGKA